VRDRKTRAWSKNPSLVAVRDVSRLGPESVVSSQTMTGRQGARHLSEEY
jgi:hypothetical protein